MGAVLREMELHVAGRLAVTTITPGLLHQCGASSSETEDLVNEPLRLASVDSSVLFQEESGGVIKVSLRSKGAVDVARVAQEFGGGGHALAAGARLHQPLDEVKQIIIARMCEELNQ